MTEQLTLPVDYASRNFKWSELDCKCGCKANFISGKAIIALQKLRDIIGKPLVVNSAARCPAYNEKVGGAPNSFHISTRSRPSQAFDISKSHGLSDADFVRYAKLVGFKGIGIYDTFIHVDTRDYEARW